jgi:hypothetical protein
MRAIVERARTAAVIICSTALLALTACAPSLPLYTAFTPSAGYGYGEQQLGESRFEVSYVAPSDIGFATSKAMRDEVSQKRVALAYDMALWRASEIALQKSFAGFTVVDRSNDLQVVLGNEFYEPPPYPNSVCGPFHPVLAGCFGGFDYSASAFPYARIDARVTLKVDYARETKPGAFDAKATLEWLKAAYPTALLADQNIE